MSRRLNLLLILLIVLLLVLPTAAQDENTVSPWDGQSRFTVLVMGMDRRPDEGDTLAVRTDAILLVSIDPATESVGVLHIPRDVHFPLADSGDFVRVNSLLQTGERIQEGYGPYFTLGTLQYNLGMYIDRYLLFDFEAFMTLVDTLGGVEVTTNYTINDSYYPNMNYGYDPFVLPAGTHTLDGYDALRFARTRHGDNDFLRGVRQMQVATAVIDRLREPGTMLQLITNAPDLLNSLRNNIFTDMTLDEMIELAQVAVSMDIEAINTASMNEAYILLTVLPSGSNAYVPDRENLVDLLTEAFGESYAP